MRQAWSNRKGTIQLLFLLLMLPWGLLSNVHTVDPDQTHGYYLTIKAQDHAISAVHHKPSLPHTGPKPLANGVPGEVRELFDPVPAAMKIRLLVTIPIEWKHLMLEPLKYKSRYVGEVLPYHNV
ncbi:hypothetical protein [Gorillibacterium sp. sgz5001074]|uniref:hypothetical protein n=1 Tax=Gorillibacterium sp. sgz5001074 TaxID=3446695 RepID=UPI003F6695A7